jgi:alkyl hydroperoxide reductase subunit F
MIYDLIIIGAGPSGMTAAVYAARKKINTLLISKEVGGQAVATGNIENYMGYQLINGLDLMDKFEEQLKQFPIERKIGEEAVRVLPVSQGFQVLTRDGTAYQSKTVIVATGKTPRRLEVPGEMEFVARGVSYCAICDGPIFTGESVAVIGGGNSALEAIVDLLKLADKVYSITDGSYTGDAVLVDRISLDPKLTIFHSYAVKEIKGGATVESIAIQNKTSGTVYELKVKGIFVEVGLTPNSSLVKDVAGLNSGQEIEVNCRSETSLPGLFAAGDVASTPEKQIIVAAGEGAKAALRANQYLQRVL